MHWDHELERAQRARKRERKRKLAVGFADGGRRDARPTLRFMESPHDFDAVHWDHEPAFGAQIVWCPAFRRSGPAKAGTPNQRFMERFHTIFAMHWNHEPTPRPSKEGSRTAWPSPSPPSRPGFQQGLARSYSRMPCSASKDRQVVSTLASPTGLSSL